MVRLGLWTSEDPLNSWFPGWLELLATVTTDKDSVDNKWVTFSPMTGQRSWMELGSIHHSQNYWWPCVHRDAGESHVFSFSLCHLHPQHQQAINEDALKTLPYLRGLYSFPVLMLLLQVPTCKQEWLIKNASIFWSCSPWSWTYFCFISPMKSLCNELCLYELTSFLP